MSESPIFGNIAELLQSKLWSIIRDNNVWGPMCGKNSTQNTNNCLSSSCRQLFKIKPSRCIVNHYYVIHPVQMKQICSYASPWSTFWCRKGQQRLLLLWRVYGTCRIFVAHSFNLSGDTWPLNIVVGPTFAFCDSQVSST